MPAARAVLHLPVCIRYIFRLQRCRRPAELPDRAAALVRALGRHGPADLLAGRLANAVMQLLVARLRQRRDGDGHTDELRRALRHMEEPKMLAETVARWRQEALDEGMSEGRRQGVSHERVLLRRLPARRFGAEAGDALAALLANEEDAERVAQVDELVVGCGSAAELLRRGGELLNGRR